MIEVPFWVVDALALRTEGTGNSPRQAFRIVERTLVLAGPGCYVGTCTNETETQ